MLLYLIFFYQLSFSFYLLIIYLNFFYYLYSIYNLNYCLKF